MGMQNGRVTTSSEPVLVTGGTGTLGRAVVRLLTARGDGVRVLSRSGAPDTVKGDLATGDDRPDRMAVAHRLAERDEVGDEAEVLERPHRLAGPAVAALDLVGDPQRAGGAGVVQPARRRRAFHGRVPVAGQDAVEDDRGSRRRALGQGRQGPRDTGRVVRRQVSTWVGRGPPCNDSGDRAAMASEMP